MWPGIYQEVTSPSKSPVFDDIHTDTCRWERNSPARCGRVRSKRESVLRSGISMCKNPSDQWETIVGKTPKGRNVKCRQSKKLASGRRAKRLRVDLLLSYKFGWLISFSWQLCSFMWVPETKECGTEAGGWRVAEKKELSPSESRDWVPTFSPATFLHCPEALRLGEIKVFFYNHHHHGHLWRTSNGLPPAFSGPISF